MLKSDPEHAQRGTLPSKDMLLTFAKTLTSAGTVGASNITNVATWSELGLGLVRACACVLVRSCARALVRLCACALVRPQPEAEL